MNRYGRDYGNHRGWLERAGETVQGWFGGGHDYDRDYGQNRGFSGGRTVERIAPGHDADRVRFVDRGYDRDFGRRGFGDRGYQGQGFGNAGHTRGSEYGRDFGGHRTTPSGYATGRGSMGYGADYDRGFRGGAGGQNRGFGNRGYGAYDYDRGGQGQYGGGGQYGPGTGSDFTGYGLDDRFGAYGVNRFRSGGGAWRPGGYFTGYGHGGPNSYMP